jgi:predicted DNA binding protein
MVSAATFRFSSGAHPMTYNPWGLTPRQIDACDALLKYGRVTKVAKDLGISVKAAEQHLQIAREKALLTNNILLAVAYSRIQSRMKGNYEQVQQ